MSTRRFFEHSESSKPKHSNLWLIIGNDFYRIQQKVQHLAKEHIGSDSMQDLERVDGSVLPLEDILSRLRNYSLFNPKQVIWIHGTEFLETVVKGHEEGVIGILREDIPEGTKVIISADSIDGRLKIIKLLKEFAEFYQFSEKDTCGDAGFFIDQKFKLSGLPGSPKLKEALIERTDGDFAKIEQEIEKMIAYAGPASQNEPKNAHNSSTMLSILEHIVPDGGDEELYELADMFGKRDISAALKIIAALLRNGESSVAILMTLVNRCRILLQAAIIVKSIKIKFPEHYDANKVQKWVGCIPSELSDQLPSEARLNILKQHPYRIYLFIKQASSFRGEDLRRFLVLSMEAFRKLISNDRDQTVLEMLLLRWASDAIV
ncbi:MAG: hypothetical protein Q8Q33_10795 [Chlamydiota bacterium]|nr:hypothetical protein [Chlamydiota bacterium]